MEDPFHGSARAWLQRLERTVGAATSARYCQSEERSLRTRKRGRGHVLRQMDGGPHIPPGTGSGDRRPVPQDVSGISAAAAAGQLQHRPGARKGAATGEVDGRCGRWSVEIDGARGRVTARVPDLQGREKSAKGFVYSTTATWSLCSSIIGSASSWTTASRDESR